MSNSDLLDAPIKRVYSTKNYILALFHCKTDYGNLSSPFPARWCATLRTRSPDTPTITIRYGVYSRAVFISLERGICAAFIRGQRLLEGGVYSRKYTVIPNFSFFPYNVFEVKISSRIQQ